MQNIKFTALLAIIPLLSACGGGDDEDGNARLNAPDMVISGLLLWDEPIVGSTVQIQCNQNEWVFEVETDGFGQFSARIPATKNLPTSLDSPHCIFRSLYTTNGGLKRVIESSATDFSGSGYLFANMNAVTTIIDGGFKFHRSKERMDRNQFSTIPAWFAEQSELSIFDARDFYLNKYSGIFPKGYKDAVLSLSFKTYQFDRQSQQAQNLMDFAGDLDRFYLAPSFVHYWQPILVDPTDDPLDPARLRFPELSESEIFERDDSGLLTVSLSKGYLSNTWDFIEDHFPSKTFDDESRNYRITVRYPDGTLYKRAEQLVFGDRVYKVTLGPQFELDALPQGTILHVFFDGFAFGYSQIKI